MTPEKPSPTGMLDSAEGKEHLQRAPTLYVIIFFKLFKGVLFLGLAVVLYYVSGGDMPEEYRKFVAAPAMQTLMTFLRIHPENKFFIHIAEQIGQLTESRVRWTAVGTICWSMFPLVEGIGLMFRTSWAGWLAICESAFFVPIEFYELARNFSVYLMLVTIINIIIVWYLFVNRERLFHHPRPKTPITD